MAIACEKYMAEWTIFGDLFIMDTAMSNSLELRTLTESNFSDFELITKDESGGGCYCSYWHQKWSSRTDWDAQCKQDPAKNRAIVLEKVRAGFHVGAVVYEGGKPMGWISVGPAPEFYWTWKRVAFLGEAAANIATIVCVTAAPSYIGSGFQERTLKALIPYARQKGWQVIEGYPFDDSAIRKHGDVIFWPGFTRSYEKAGFNRAGPHWLSNPEAERSIYRFDLRM
jgi:GNAT superfamily N-acetyltransferase